VHTAYEECLQATSGMPDVEQVSGLRAYGRSVILHVHTMGPIMVLRMLTHRGPRLITAHVTPASLIGNILGADHFPGFARWYMKVVYNLSDLVLSVSQATTAELEEIGVRRRIHLTVNAIDERQIQLLSHQRSSLRQEFGWGDELVILGVGQIQSRKGIEEFVECARRLPHLRFVWVGGMPFGVLSDRRSELTRLCENAPENVRFTGLLPREKVFEYYAASDVFFLPSKHETFGLATLEAATAGLPLILSDLDCYQNWLQDAYVHGETVTDYVEMIRSMESAAQRAKWGEQASEVAARYGTQMLTHGLREAYSLASRRSPSSQKS
jgi:1,2-diacylglycerol-3-alpha-glucose alpha-1,2-galactosyltransferase